MKKFIASQFNCNFSRKRKRDCCSWSKSRKMKVKRDWSLKYQMGRLNASMRNNNYRNIRTEQWQPLFTLVTQYVSFVGRKYVAWLTKQWLRERLASMQIFFSFTVSKSNITKSPFNSWLFFVVGKKLIFPHSHLCRDTSSEAREFRVGRQSERAKGFRQMTSGSLRRSWCRIFSLARFTLTVRL